MKSASKWWAALVCSVLVPLGNGHAAAPFNVIELWPKGPPGEKGEKGEKGELGEERDMTKPSDGSVAGKPVIRLGNVSKPTISIYRPASEKDMGAAVLVCPGGGYHILAMDLEGTEVCEWLNSIGVTSVLLKYRVPKRAGVEPHVAPLQDAQRALGWVRSRAKDLGVDPQRIGVLGFSAGGNLGALLSNQREPRSYPVVDEVDTASCRPDFTILIYPAYLTVKEEGDRIRPDLVITSNSPPAFIAMAEDDPVRIENALFYALALKNAKVPVELHVYPTGGHGYGLRPAKDLVTRWPERATEWMRSRGLLERK